MTRLPQWMLPVVFGLSAVAGIVALVLAPAWLHPALTDSELRGVTDAERRITLRQKQSELQNNARATLLQGLAGDHRPVTIRTPNLSYTDLRKARLDGARLCCADLRGADLTGATLDGADLAGVRTDPHTIWPSGFTPTTPQTWFSDTISACL